MFRKVSNNVGLLVRLGVAKFKQVRWIQSLSVCYLRISERQYILLRVARNRCKREKLVAGLVDDHEHILLRGSRRPPWLACFFA